MITVECLHPRGADLCGYIPTFLDDTDPRRRESSLMSVMRIVVAGIHFKVSRWILKPM